MVTVIFPSPSPFFLALYSHQVAKPWIATFCIERVYELFCHPHHEPRLYQGDGVCIPCDAGTFSTDTGVDPCRRCTQCNLLNRLALTACSPTSDTVCGHCLPGLVPFTAPEKTPVAFRY
uniref:TNFR-Cys domain-containing protein n=1 Tax=Xiphophorus maculatus TaxID=8083 RepID=A0A3B5RDP5_XIPMA